MTQKDECKGTCITASDKDIDLQNIALSFRFTYTAYNKGKKSRSELRNNNDLMILKQRVWSLVAVDESGQQQDKLTINWVNAIAFSGVAFPNMIKVRIDDHNLHKTVCFDSIDENCKRNNLREYDSIVCRNNDDRLDAKEIKYCVCCSTNNRLRVSLSVYARNYFLTCDYCCGKGCMWNVN